MDWITEDVAIGNYLEAQDVALLTQHGVRSAVSLDGTLTVKHTAELGLAEIASYRLIDGAGNDLRLFRLAVDDLHRLVRLQPPVLVQCHAGRSRSAVVVAAYLMQVWAIAPEEALAAIAAKRDLNVTPALVNLLHQLER